MYDQVAVLLAKLLLAGGGIALIVWKVLQAFGSKWLAAEFDKRLKAIQHEHNKEIEKLRSELTKAFDRRSKLHQREFEVLPDVWGKTCDAYWHTRSLVSPVQTHPDLSRMAGPQLESFIVNCELGDWQKAELREQKDKTAYYMKNVFWHRLQDTRRLVTAASNSLGKQGIFINKETRERLDELITLLWSALAEEEMNQAERPVPRLRDDIRRLMGEGEQLRDSLESEIREILWQESQGAP